MALKSGTSHASAALLLTIISALIIKFFERHSVFEVFFQKIDQFSLEVANFISYSLDIYIDESFITIVLLSSFFCFFWGIIYHQKRHS